VIVARILSDDAAKEIAALYDEAGKRQQNKVLHD
jgi:hypothetical protein